MNAPYPISDNHQEQLTALWDRFRTLKPEKPKRQSKVKTPSVPKQQVTTFPAMGFDASILLPEDYQIIASIEASASVEKWRSLASGSNEYLQGHDKSGSAIDMRLVGLLNCFTDDYDQIERLWLYTPHGQRDKTRNRPDYRDRTIQGVMVNNLPLVDFSALDALENNKKYADNQPPSDEFTATPFSLAEALQVPMREFFYGKGYLKGIAAMTASPGGIGKSMLVMTEAMAMAACKPLLGVAPFVKRKVWYWNGEDTRDELMRRFAGAAKYYNLDQSDFDNALFVNSGHDTEIVVAETTKGGVEIQVPVKENLIRVIRENSLDVVIIDPFISSHKVPEGDNNSIDAVVKMYSKIAAQEGVCIMLVHHTRKLNGQHATGDDMRGGSSIRDAVRSARLLHPMSQKEASEYGIKDNAGYFYATEDKQNFAKRSNAKEFYHMENVRLDNGNFGKDTGDFVGVVTRWHPTQRESSITEDQVQAIKDRLGMQPFRFNEQASAWVGYTIAEALGVNIEDAGRKRQIKHMLAEWVLSGAIEKYSEVHKGQERPMARFADYDKIISPPPK